MLQNIDFNEMKKIFGKRFVVTDYDKMLLGYKGERLDKIPSSFTAVFVFPSGIDVENQEIVFIVLMKYKDFKYVGKYESIVRPIKGTVLDYSYQHGYLGDIVDVINQGLGCTFNEQADEIWSFIGDDPLVGCNTILDITFLYDAFKKKDGRELSNDYIDIIDFYNVAYDDSVKSLYAINGDCPIYGSSSAAESCKLIGDTLCEINEEYEEFSAKYNELDKIAGKQCLITGSLKLFKPRKKLEEKIKNLGGKIDSEVKTTTDYLVIGDFKGLEDNKSNKIYRAEEFIVKYRSRIKLVSEEMFLKMFPELLEN